MSLLPSQMQSGGGAKKQLAEAGRWFRALGASAGAALTGARGDDALEEPEYLKVKDYVAGGCSAELLVMPLVVLNPWRTAQRHTTPALKNLAH